jgi:hypothetical protein
MAKKNKSRHLAGKTTPRQVTRRIDEPSVPGAPSADAEMPPEAPAQAAPVQPLGPATTVAQPRPVRGLQSSRMARPVRVAVNAIDTNYDYVVSDIKRIAVLAISLFVVMGILTFILR